MRKLTFCRCKNHTDRLYHHAQFGGALTSPVAGGQKSSMCLSDTFLNGGVCANDFSIQGVGIWKRFWFLRMGKIGSCAPAFTVDSALPLCAMFIVGDEKPATLLLTRRDGDCYSLNSC